MSTSLTLADTESLKLAHSYLIPWADGRHLMEPNFMDAASHTPDVPTGHEYPLTLDFIGVENRSQQDINVSAAVALESSAEFFRAIRSTTILCVHKNGTKSLAKTLNQVRTRCVILSFGKESFNEGMVVMGGFTGGSEYIRYRQSNVSPATKSLPSRTQKVIISPLSA